MDTWYSISLESEKLTQDEAKRVSARVAENLQKAAEQKGTILEVVVSVKSKKA